jgi:hypothetical protein
MKSKMPPEYKEIIENTTASPRIECAKEREGTIPNITTASVGSPV